MSDTNPLEATPVETPQEPPAEAEATAPKARRPRSRKPADNSKPDVFDEQIAARQAEAATAAREQAERAEPEGSERTRVRLPDPYNLVTISLSDEKTGPKVRLLRSRQHGDLWLQFDQNPGQEITSAIKDEGWHWEARAGYQDHKGAWVKPLEPGNEWSNEMDAKALLKDVANRIRAERGLEPASVMGVSDR
jgi:hypothetical protein